jgi:hypothetical protein
LYLSPLRREYSFDMALHADLLQSCVEEAARAAKAALEHCIDEAVAGLQIAETQSTKVTERNQLSAASRELLKHKPHWLAQYPFQLLQAFEAGVSKTAFAALTADVPIPGAGSSPPAQLARSGRAALKSLSLVDDADVSQAIEASRLLQQVLPAVDVPLAELDKLISAAQGLGSVRRELNPLRPEVFTQVLRDLIFATSAEPGIAPHWIRYLAAPLGRELKLVYERAVNQLEMANVQGVSYRVVQTPSGGGSSSGSGNAGSAGSASAKGERGSAESRSTGQQRVRTGGGTADTNGGDSGDSNGRTASGNSRAPTHFTKLSDQVERMSLMRNFLQSEGGALPDPGLAPEYYDDIEAELRALKGAPDSSPARFQSEADLFRTDELASSYRNMPAVDRPRRAVGEGSQLSQKVWGVFARRKERALVRTELKKDAKRVSQVLGLDMVHKLVGRVAQDPRLLTPVREAIVALEPSLGRLAMIDPRFFSDETHAGRRLMERVAQRSFKYNDEFSAEFIGFFEPVAAAFNRLNGLEIANAEPFSDALFALENAWSAQDREEAAQRNAMLQALRFAEERQTQADAISFDLSQRTDLDGVPGVILDFLFGPWALVMANARLADTRNQIDPQGYGGVVPNLVWSSKRDMTLKQPAKLIEMIPGLLTKLHEGLNLLGKDPAETTEFFEGLMRLHQPVLKLRRKKSLQDAEESDASPLELEEPPATPEQRLAKAAEQPWLARGELEAAGFNKALPTGADFSALSGYAANDGTGTSTSAFFKESDSGAISINASISAGLGADESGAGLLAEREAGDALAALYTGVWVDLYARRRWCRAQLVWASSKGTLFMFESHGGQPHSMTRRSCERLIRQRLLRPVATHGVVAHALDAVKHEATGQSAASGESRSAQLARESGAREADFQTAA